ncbi:unnamed protein product [Tenebrio molitor]|nr:unnamed protein product [Tenebrio molitor]
MEASYILEFFTALLFVPTNWTQHNKNKPICVFS